MQNSSEVLSVFRGLKCILRAGEIGASDRAGELGREGAMATSTYG